MKRLLINRTDISEWKQVSQTVHDKVLNQFIFDAQFQDIQRLLGVEFFNDLMRNYDSAIYQSLLNESDYTYNSVTYSMVGLKSVIVHYAYARYVLLGHNTDTPFGMVVKGTDNSTQTTEGNKKTIHKINQEMGFNLWENVLDYINRNISDYPLFRNSDCGIRTGGFRISKIG